MKTMSKIFGLFLMVAVAFSSCGSDDDGPTPTPKNREVSDKPYSIAIAGMKDVQTATPENSPQVLELSTLLGVDDAKNLIAGSEFQRGKSYIMVSGLDSATVLKDFSIKVGNKAYVSLGNCTIEGSGANEFKANTQLSDDKYTEIVKDVFNLLCSGDKKARVWIKFVASEEVSSAKNVKLVINVAGNYKYNTYPSTTTPQ